MNLLVNHTQIGIVDIFNNKYASKCISICSILQKFKINVFEKEGYINLYPEKTDDTKDTPLCFFYNKIELDASTTQADIIIDNLFVKKLQYNEKELLASLGHEVGHIIFQFHSCKCSFDTYQEELIADYYSNRMGLRESLISALEKLYNCNSIHQDIKKQLKCRITSLEKQLNPFTINFV